LVNDAVGYDHIVLVARVKTSLYDLTTTISGATNIYTLNQAGTSNFWGGDNWSWRVWVEITALTDNAKRNLIIH